MRNKSAALIIGIFLILISSREAFASVAFVVGSNQFVFDQNIIEMDAAPYIKDGRTYLPLRYAAQGIGLTESNIIWDSTSRRIILVNEDINLQLTIGSNLMLVNNVPVNMDVPPEIRNN
ncbi:MAG: copper amine oxidase N-terminal domain-containing protein, partial [Peptococcaceae bacterium]|nr:copper amine oxidase N-terminal domain-containing protein [Peptococcaceae bacterium]